MGKDKKTPKQGVKKSNVKKVKPPKPLDVAAILAQVIEVESAENVALEMVDLIVTEGAKILFQHFVDAKAIETTAIQTVENCLAAVEWNLLPHDFGEISPPPVPPFDVTIELDSPTSMSSSPRAGLTPRILTPGGHEGTTTDLDVLALEQLKRNVGDAGGSAETMTVWPAEEPSPAPSPEGGELVEGEGGPPDVKVVWVDKDDGSAMARIYKNQLWTCEEEPEPCSVDVWARGIVRVKRKGKSRFQEFLHNRELDDQGPLEIDVVSDTRSVGSRSARSSGSTRTSQGGGRRRKPRGSVPSTIKEVHLPEKMEQPANPEQAEREKFRSAELRKMEKKRNAARRAAAKQSDEEAEEARLHKLQENLKGKNYTFDPEGKVIMIKPMKAEKMPSTSFSPAVRVKEAGDESSSEDESADGKKKKKKKKKAPNGSSTGSQGNRRRKTVKQQNKAPALEHFVDLGTGSTAPSIDKVALAPGVTIRHQGSVRSGSRNGGDENSSDLTSCTLTRKEYNEILALQATADGFGSSQVMKPMGSSARQETKEQSIRPSSGATQQQDRKMSQPDPMSSSLGRSPDPREADKEHELALAAAMGEVPPKPKELSRVRRRNSGSTLSPMDAFNAKLLEDPTWGDNPVGGQRYKAAPPPAGMSLQSRTKFRENTVGHRAWNPRDRPFIETQAPAARKRLPPPIYPATSGHGFVKTYLGDDSGVTLPSIRSAVPDESKEVESSFNVSSSYRKDFGHSLEGTIQTTEKTRFYFKEQKA